VSGFFLFLASFLFSFDGSVAHVDHDEAAD
jgi:hypothetical protein